MSADSVELCVVSKFKGASDVLVVHAYNPAIVFGENYVQELTGKSAEIDRLRQAAPHHSPHLPSPHLSSSTDRSPQFTFIGALQKNKVKTLLQDVPTLLRVESVASESLALKLQVHASHRLLAAGKPSPRLEILIQVNREQPPDNRNGVVGLEATLALARSVTRQCPALELRGVMTVAEHNARLDFDFARKCMEAMVEESLIERPLLSMGMSGDFELALSEAKGFRLQIRVGTAIMGPRKQKESVI